MTCRALARQVAGRGATPLAALLFLAAGTLTFAAEAEAQQRPAVGQADARVGLPAGLHDAGEAASNLELIAHIPRPEGFFNPQSAGDGAYSNTDLAFRGDYAYVGNYHGFNVYDISDPNNPTLRLSLVCPGGQGDLSIFGDLLFMSVEQTRGRIDCGTQGTEGEVDPARFRGVRIFDLSDMDSPRQIAAVQTCRGSHTHTLVSDPNDEENLYVYVSGTSVPRPDAELAGCTGPGSEDHPNTSFFRIEVIEVPLSAPQNARVVSSPRVFADAETGDFAGLWPGGDHGPGTQSSRLTNQCHDITAYPEIGLAAGACSGNGILFDISDPKNPVRIDEVVDPGFAYWHSATFSNDGSTVIFTDEWGGGGQPRCLATDSPEWGANAIYDVVNGKLQFASYYKLPAPQTATENCVAHNGSLIPVPGRDIKVQAWYQGGVSVFDFTDSTQPFEIAYFDRGPVSETELLTGGYWSTYWYNGLIYGSEIVRGFDVLRLVPSEQLSQNEIDAAKLVRFDEFNPQQQPGLYWPASFVVVRAYLDQAVRHAGLSANRAAEVRAELDRLERMRAGAQKRSALAELATQLWADAQRADAAGHPHNAERLRSVTGAVLDLAAEER